MSTRIDSVEPGSESHNTIPMQKQRYPKSFLKLMLFGFSIIGLPLIGALINSAMSIDRLAEQSRKTVHQATQVTLGNRVLIDEIRTMERSIRQALILGDMSLLEGYFRAHSKFEMTAEKLWEHSSHIEQRLLLEKIRLSETTIFMEILTAIDDSPEDLRGLVENFTGLMESANNFSIMGQNLIGVDVSEMLDMASHARTVVEWQLLALIPFVILLALIFSVLITRPIRQIDEAIYKMGQGELSKPVCVEGPQNLKYIGIRLDWMRRRLLKLEDQKIQFLRHVSHELKTPLAAIREGADLLAEGITGQLTKKQQLIANILHSSSLQLQKRIEDLLSYSALETDKTALVKHQVKLAKILDEVLQNQNLSIMSKRLEIIRDCPGLMLECDSEKIKIILDNLLSNAVKFSPPCGVIQIKVVQTNKLVQLDIVDMGVGIHKVDQEKIFEPFYQGRSVANTHVRGTGLGLSIAREYAFAHGGNIELIQQSEVGAHFRLTLPLNDTEGEA
ncbi:two-component system, NtrC family, sensor histidine kinase GlrK [Nitrosomonas cryotolerans]|uniref:histidine kinase n=2 Tax=Nitrosomonas cryotolerans TaxID=44575 RepID=A0A1N6IMS4_9PROT|nr:ATP-binding protein [Nitrosomonas cryotolerans]SFP36446.1 two-component system, NtrC family, sensor histidine kinase GlrK [Nitrosomonas cryotolerans]SIO33273.1 two-component system, NtrC family, sensor histidine kinase GlrK [Nitrosomonas cryotolerans ATCC 49181]